MIHTLTVPARYWDDFGDRSPIEHECEMPIEIKRSGHRVTITADEAQLNCLLGDAEFYATGNTDDTPRAVLSGAKRVMYLCKQIKTAPGQGHRS